MNKILLHITKPWKTFRNEQPPNYVLQSILQHNFDTIFDPGTDSAMLKSASMAKKTSAVPLELLLKEEGGGKISKEEENTFIYQVRRGWACLKNSQKCPH